jgi:hypothetical protein
MEKPKLDVTAIMDEVISYTQPKKEDWESQQKKDALNFAIWQIGNSIAELKSIVDNLSKVDVDKEAS